MEEMICDLCQINFKFFKNLLAHYRKKHPNCSPPKQLDSKPKLNCTSLITCSLCKSPFSKLEDLIFHLGEIHSVKIETEILDFGDFESFKLWKEKIEKDTKSRFVKTRGTRVCKGLSHEKIYLSCSRSGYFKSRSKGFCHLKTQGSCKINGTCPAAITVNKLFDGKCQVSFIKTHIGHTADVAHLEIAEKDRASLAQKISAKIPFQSILNELRESLLQETSVGRKYLISRKDLHNIEQCFNLNHEGVRHKNDWVSVQSWVNEEADKEENSCVLFYKPQGMSCNEHEELKKDDFFLAIMNEAQGEMLKRFGNNVVCVDGTHGLNQYDFELVTLLTLDDMHQGFPCAFLFSNRTDQVALELFYNLVKSKVGEIHPTVFMSDMAESFFNGWTSIINKPAKRLFCTWHVIKAWKQNVKEKVRAKEKQTDVFNKVVTLLEETDSTTFSKVSQHILQTWKKDPDTQDFAQYFEVNYLKCAESWAFCHRLHSTVNTNMHIESIHKIIKYMYFHGKRVKRLDKAIHTILAFVRDKLFDRLIILNKGKITSKVKHLRNKHKSSLSLKTETVVQSGDHWMIPSTTSNKIYKVTEVELNCQCQLVCTDCNACIHKYRCTCIDNAIKWNMCKHIHLLCRLKSGTSSSPISKINLSDDNVTEGYFCRANKLVETEESFEERKVRLLKYVEDLISSASNTEELNVIENAVKPIKPTIESMNQSQPCPNQIVEGNATKRPDKIPANKNITKQRFFSTKKKCRRPKRGLRKPYQEEKNAITLNFLMEESKLSDSLFKFKVIEHDHSYYKRDNSPS